MEVWTAQYDGPRLGESFGDAVNRRMDELDRRGEEMMREFEEGLANPVFCEGVRTTLEVIDNHVGDLESLKRALDEAHGGQFTDQELSDMADPTPEEVDQVRTWLNDSCHFAP